MAATPFVKPKQEGLYVVTVLVSATGEVNTVVEVKVVLFPLSRVMMVYARGLKPVATDPVCWVGIQVKENGPTPPETFTVADPKVAQEMEVLLIDSVWEKQANRILIKRRPRYK